MASFSGRKACGGGSMSVFGNSRELDVEFMYWKHLEIGVVILKGQENAGDLKMKCGKKHHKRELGNDSCKAVRGKW